MLSMPPGLDQIELDFSMLQETNQNSLLNQTEDYRNVFEEVGFSLDFAQIEDIQAPISDFNTNEDPWGYSSYSLQEILPAQEPVQDQDDDEWTPFLVPPSLELASARQNQELSLLNGSTAMDQFNLLDPDQNSSPAPGTRGFYFGTAARARETPLPPVIVDDPNDTIDKKRARNTLAARNSRNKKTRRFQELEDLAKLNKIGPKLEEALRGEAAVSATMTEVREVNMDEVQNSGQSDA
jgi:hypothetical protein